MLSLNRMKLPTEVSATAGDGGGPVPVCIKDYARENVIARTDPVFTEHRFNPVPVRVIIRYKRQNKTHSPNQRLSRSGEGHHRRVGAMEVQAVRHRWEAN